MDSITLRIKPSVPSVTPMAQHDLTTGLSVILFYFSPPLTPHEFILCIHLFMDHHLYWNASSMTTETCLSYLPLFRQCLTQRLTM